MKYNLVIDEHEADVICSALYYYKNFSAVKVQETTNLALDKLTAYWRGVIDSIDDLNHRIYKNEMEENET